MTTGEEFTTDPSATATAAPDPQASVETTSPPTVAVNLEPTHYDNAPAEPPPVEAPVNVDAPYVGQTANLLNCTMGNWTGMDAEPHSYAYQWQSDGVNLIGAESADYAVLPADLGHSFTCALTATNAAGSATVISNAVVVV